MKKRGNVIMSVPKIEIIEIPKMVVMILLLIKIENIN